MNQGIEAEGAPSTDELERSPGFPSRNRLSRGAVAVIECVQEIPCDVCEAACPFEAIRLTDLSSLPELDENRCTGCGNCIAQCPGQAIFVVDQEFNDKEALVSFPYEFLPVPEAGSIVDATDRLGKPVTKGRVIEVQEQESLDHTLVVSIAVPKGLAQEARGIVVGGDCRRHG